MEIPSGYFGKFYPRSKLLKECFISCDAGVIDSDFRGSVFVLITKNSNKPLLIKPGQRIAQKRRSCVYKCYFFEFDRKRSWRFWFNKNLVFFNLFLVFKKISAQEVEYVVL